jgi:hypothetical protein
MTAMIKAIGKKEKKRGGCFIFSIISFKYLTKVRFPKKEFRKKIMAFNH